MAAIITKRNDRINRKIGYEGQIEEPYLVEKLTREDVEIIPTTNIYIISAE